MSAPYMQVSVTPTSEDWIEPYMEAVPRLAGAQNHMLLLPALEGV